MLKPEIRQSIIIVAGQLAALNTQNAPQPPCGERLFVEFMESFETAYFILAKRFEE